MKRRDFLQTASLAALGTTSAIAGAKAASPKAQIHWKMVTAWPKNFPGPGVSANRLATYNARNAVALKSLVDDHQVKLSHLPDAVINALRDKTAQVLTELADKDATTGRVYKAYRKFAKQAIGWTTVAEYAYLKARNSGKQNNIRGIE